MGLLDGLVIPKLGRKAPTGPKKAKTATPVVRERQATGKAPVDPLENYLPRRRVLYIGRQVCRECGETTEYIAGDLLEYSHLDKVAGVRTIRTRAFNARDYRWTSLRRDMEYLQEESCTCPSCIRTDEIFTAVFNDTEALQLPLFL